MDILILSPKICTFPIPIVINYINATILLMQLINYINTTVMSQPFGVFLATV